MRGNIDVFMTSESVSGTEARVIDKELFMNYYRQITSITGGLILEGEQNAGLVSSILRFPDVISVEKNELDANDLAAIENAMHEAVTALIAFRTREGEVLHRDLGAKVENILSILSEAEQYEAERVPLIRQRILSRMEELALSPDHDRLEQEMIFYLEKLDVNEEKVRLRQHCRYFTDTMESEEYPGKKLGFIAQEMGREINTLGSKSNHAGMQKCVVRMKDELEKIKEQVLNVL